MLAGKLKTLLTVGDVWTFLDAVQALKDSSIRPQQNSKRLLTILSRDWKDTESNALKKALEMLAHLLKTICWIISVKKILGSPFCAHSEFQEYAC